MYSHQVYHHYCEYCDHNTEGNFRQLILCAFRKMDMQNMHVYAHKINLALSKEIIPKSVQSLFVFFYIFSINNII